MEFELENTRIGTVLNGRYRLIERIASGGMGTVYRGERIELGRPVAIKFLQEFFTDNPKLRARFEREAMAMSKLEHPYCVSVIDFGISGAPYIVMDFVTGTTLKDILRQERLSISRTMRIANQVLAALAHAHGRGIIHRDIKPGNIMLCEATGLGEHVRIFDFGLAKLMDKSADVNMSLTSVVLGTPSYMSPEQSFGRDVDSRSDIYSVGVVMFEMLTGKKPFSNSDLHKLLEMVREQEPPTLSEADPDISFSGELEAVIGKALAKDPIDRFQTAEEFARALNTTPEMQSQATGGDAVSPESSPSLLTGIDPTMDVTLKPIGERTDIGEAASTPSEPEDIGPDKPESVSTAPPPLSLKGLRPFLYAVVGVALLTFVFAVARQKTHRSTPSRETAREQVRTPAPHQGQAAPVTAPLPKKAVEKPSIPTLSAVMKLIEQGHSEEALEGLKLLRRKEPNNTEIICLLGDLYFEKMWWADALELYAEAIRLNPEHRSRPSINQNLISALGSEKTARRARSFIIKKIEDAALPFLRNAAVQSDNYKIRMQARSIIKAIDSK